MVVMHHLEDRPLAEIAASLHMPVGTVKWRLHEARQALQQALEAHGMSTPDRTDELVRAMLERRAGGPVPAWLLGTTMQQVTTAGRARGGTRWSAPCPGAPRRHPRARRRRRAPARRPGGRQPLRRPASSTAPAPRRPPSPRSSSSPPAAPSAHAGRRLPRPPAAPPAASPPPTPRPVPDALVADTMAVVTQEGDRLRVRTAPGVGEDSLKLNPLLGTGTRMLVISGPVAADGYDWYEVRTEKGAGPPYGWVAVRQGRGGLDRADGTGCPDPAIDRPGGATPSSSCCATAHRDPIVPHWNVPGRFEDLGLPVDRPWSESRPPAGCCPTWTRGLRAGSAGRSRYGRVRRRITHLEDAPGRGDDRISPATSLTPRPCAVLTRRRPSLVPDRRCDLTGTSSSGLEP